MNLTRTIAKLRAKQPVTLVAFGDSNTEVTFHTRGRMNWCGLLAEAIFEEYGHGLCTFINSGKCGSSFAEGLTRIDRDVIRHKPDAVILAFGMNDSGAGVEHLPAFRDAAMQTISRLRAVDAQILIRTSNPIVGVHGLPLPREIQVGRPAEFPPRALKEYCAELVRLGAEMKIPVVDHYTLWTQKRVPFKHPVCNPQELWPLMSDAIHPGELGHLRFFRELAPYFEVSSEFPWENVTR
jgi:lysophospholipase L1-like esterase